MTKRAKTKELLLPKLKTNRVEIDELEYPDSDGMPVAETGVQVDILFDLFMKLRHRFADREDVYVGCDMFVYYREGQPAYSLVPDCFVAFGVKNRGARRNFKSWEEGALPSVIIEVNAGTAQHFQMIRKSRIYEDDWKVQEHFYFDPLGDFLDPRLVGYRRTRGKYQSIKAVDGALTSQELGIKLSYVGIRLKLHDTITNQPILGPKEIQKSQIEEARIDLKHAGYFMDLVGQDAKQVLKRAKQAQLELRLAEDRLKQAEAHSKLNK